MCVCEPHVLGVWCEYQRNLHLRLLGSGENFGTLCDRIEITPVVCRISLEQGGGRACCNEKEVLTVLKK